MTLEQWMKDRNLDDAALAEKVGVLSRSQISRIRRGECKPRPEAAKALARVTRIPVAKFLLGEVV